MIESFFFRQTDTRHYSILRIVFGIFLFLTILGFYKSAEINYSSDGWFSINRGAISLFSFFSDSTLNAMNSPAHVKIFFAGMLIFSILLIVGLFTKFALAVVIIGLVFIKYRNPMIWFAGDQFINIMLIYLFFSPCGKSWSVDNLINKGIKQSTTSILMLRMIQIHIALIYFINGFANSLDNNWIVGNSALMIALNPIHNAIDLSFLAQFPAIIDIVRLYTILIVIWQLLYPLLFLNKYTKYMSFLFGISMHLGSIIFLRIELFGYIMLASYLVFLPTNVIVKIQNILNISRRRIRSQK